MKKGIYFALFLSAIALPQVLHAKDITIPCPTLEQIEQTIAASDNSEGYDVQTQEQDNAVIWKIYTLERKYYTGVNGQAYYFNPVPMTSGEEVEFLKAIKETGITQTGVDFFPIQSDTFRRDVEIKCYYSMMKYSLWSEYLLSTTFTKKRDSSCSEAPYYFFTNPRRSSLSHDINGNEYNTYELTLDMQ